MVERAVGRVLMTADTVGGVWTFAMELCEALGEHGTEVVLATLGGEPSDDQRAQAAEIANLRLRSSAYKLEWMEEPWRDVEASGEWLLALEKECAPDIIHLNTLAHGALPWRASAVLTVHSCVVSWWKAVHGVAPPDSWDLYATLVRRSLRAAAAIVAPTRALMESVQANYGVDAPACRVIANGRDPARFQAAVKEPFILSAGRLWDEAKNVRALAAITTRVPWPVYVAGESDDWLPGCHSLGRLTAQKLADRLARTSIYAAPALYEPFGLSILEAALAGCALVLGDIDSLREIWGDAALFVLPTSTEALAAALRWLIDNPAQREEFAQKSSRRALEFTARRMGSEYAGLYTGLFEQGRVACAS